MNEFKSGFVTVIGVPNAGKSSLVNKLVRESVSIVTAKPQTTRKRTLGILTEKDQYQVVFVDTPGVIESEAGLNPFLKHELESSLKDVDVVISAIAPWEFESKNLPWCLQMRKNLRSPSLFIATQIDKLEVDREILLQRWTEWVGLEPVPLHFTSSRTGEGLEDLKNQLVGILKPGPLYYDLESYTPQTMREMSTEVIRKHCFERLHQEIPYGLAVNIQKFEEGKIIKIEADILVNKESHKGMVIGSGGLVLKQIGTRSRFELEKMFESQIFLKLHVVAKPWIGQRGLMEELGYAP